MDDLLGLPAAVLCIIHSLVHEAGGLRDALALEATSKSINRFFVDNARLQKDVAVQHKDVEVGSPSSFRRWIAAHGRRVDHLRFHLGTVDNEAIVPPLCQQAGLTDARALTIFVDKVWTLQPLEGLRNLVRLDCDTYIMGVCGHEYLQPLESLPALRSLTLGDADNCCGGIDTLELLTHLTALSHLSLASMAITTLPPLATLKSLVLQDMPGYITTLEPLARLTRLTSLHLRWFFRLQQGLEPLSALPLLQRLYLVHVSGVGEDAPLDLTPLGSITCLQSLALDRCPIADLRPLASLGSTLQALNVSDCGIRDPDSISWLEPISRLTSLQELHLHDWGDYKVTTLEPVGGLGGLVKLEVTCGKDVGSLEPLSRLTSLQELLIKLGPGVSSLEPLRALTSLRLLLVSTAPGVSDLGPLGALVHLTTLLLSSLPCVSDLAPLGALGELRTLSLVACPLVDKAAVDQLQSRLPMVKLHRHMR